MSDDKYVSSSAVYSERISYKCLSKSRRIIKYHPAHSPFKSYQMVERSDLAWRILQIVALALPALGILLQVITHLDWEGYDSTPHHYHISSSMIFLIVPITAAGIISAGVIAFSYDVLWLQIAAGSMAISFLFVPLVLYSVYKRARERNSEFLDREKEAIAEAAEEGEMKEEVAEEQIERIERWQGGLLSHMERHSNKIESLLNRHPVLFFGFYGIMFIFGVNIFLQDTGFWMTILAVWLFFYPLIRIGGRLIPFPELDNK